MKPERMDEDQIEGIVQNAVQDAVDFIESEIAQDRIKSQRYFDGEVDIGQEVGRSKVVATKVRDAVRSIKPSLMRVFLSTDRPVEYIPQGPEDISTAQQATQYMHWSFNKLNGYDLLSDVFHDALVKKVGVLKIYWDKYTDAETYSFTNLTDEEFSAIVNEDDIDVIEHSEEISIEADEMGMEIETKQHSVTVNRKTERGMLQVEAVPPEEFMIDRNARSIDDFYVVAHRTEMRVSDVVNMGYDFEKVSSLTGIGSSDTYSELEDFERRGYQQDEDNQSQDPSMKLVAITEAYMKMDIEGTGIAQMYKFTLGGNDYQLLDHEPWTNDVPFAIFEIDPEPHAFFGRSIADLIMDDQDAATAMLRGVLDNVALTNNPRLGIMTDQVNIDDVLNNEIGGIIRMKNPQAIVPITVPFVAAQTLVAIQYMDNAIESKTGVSRASMGLDPDSLQNTTATAAQMTKQAGAAQVEVMARNLAEGGMKRLFKIMLRLFVENTDEEQMMRMNSEFVPIDPRVWNTSMDVMCNVGLGTGKEDEKMMMLQQALQLQMQIWQSYGPGNGLVTMTLIRNTLADMLALAGVRNSDRYFTPMNEQYEQQLLQMKQQQAQGQPQPLDPGQALVQAETLKAQTKAQSDMVRMQIDAQKAIAQDDRERDKMDQDLLIRAAEILGKYGTSIDVANIKESQKAPRYPDERPSEAVSGGRF